MNCTTRFSCSITEIKKNGVYSAFYLNGIIHFVLHSEFINGYNGINYNRLEVSTLTNWNSIFGVEGYDYSYPSIASFATNETDKSAMICFLRSSSTIYPETRVIACDEAGNWTNSSIIKQGETYIDCVTSDGVTRWGDYTSICRKYNSILPEVWLAGSFGKYRLGYHATDTWIAQIKEITTENNNISNTAARDMFVSPNPINSTFRIDFNLEINKKINISIFDINGKLIKLLYEDIAHKGKNIFSFNKGALSSGIYFLTIKANNRIIENKKIVIY